MIKVYAGMALSALLLTPLASAGEWDQVLGEAQGALYTSGYSGVLLGQAAHPQDNFDLWIVSSGYRQPLAEGWSLFFEAGSALSRGQQSHGYQLASGLRYQPLPQLAVGSQLRQLSMEGRQLAWQLNSSLLLHPALLLQADLAMGDEQSLTLGLGFHF